MGDFEFQTPPRIVCKDGAAPELGRRALELGMKRPVIVTDAGLVRSGVIQPAVDGFAAAGCPATVFSDVLADPPEERVHEAVRFARGHRADGVIGLGGGSSMDTAKLVALLACTEQPLESIYGIGLVRGPRLPLIQVPTTAGTGSEVTPIAIVTTPSSEKKGVVSPVLYADMVLLDAGLTLGLPPALTAMTGVDAIVHAVEAYTTKHKKNPLSDALAVQALRMLHGNIRTAVRQGSDRPARAAMLQGATLAGMAFANAPCAAVHALAYPLGGHHHVAHGHSNALVLVPVLRFNAPAAEAMYAELAGVILPCRGGVSPPALASPRQACEAFIQEIASVVQAMPFAQRLRDVGIAQDELEVLAADAMKVTRLLVNNPRELKFSDAVAIYRSVW